MDLTFVDFLKLIEKVLELPTCERRKMKVSNRICNINYYFLFEIYNFNPEIHIISQYIRDGYR